MKKLIDRLIKKLDDKLEIYSHSTVYTESVILTEDETFHMLMEVEGMDENLANLIITKLTEMMTED